MKVLVLLALLTVGLCGGYTVQWYALPRIGLHAMTFGQYFVFYLLLIVCYGAIEFLKGALDG